MRRTPLVATAALLSAICWPLVAQFSTPATAADATSRLGVVNAFTFDASSPSGSVSLCVNGENYVDGLAAGDTSEGAAVDVGTATIGISSGDVADVCADPDVTTTVNVPSGPFSTLMIYRQPEGAQFSAVAFAEDDTCVAQGESRLVVRHAAFDGSLDVHATPPGGSDTVVVSGLASGTEQVTDLAAGSYTDVHATTAGNASDTRIEIGTLSLPDTTTTDATRTELYLWGGADGSEGAFTVTTDIDSCAANPTTTAPTTTAAPTTTEPAAAAAVEATPAFTG